ncbi:hypothetical protein ID1059_14820 [Helicobacter pylori]
MNQLMQILEQKEVSLKNDLQTMCEQILQQELQSAQIKEQETSQAQYKELKTQFDSLNKTPTNFYDPTNSTKGEPCFLRFEN